MINKMKFKTKLTATLVAIFMLVANIGLAIAEFAKLSIFKKVIDAYTESISLSNSDFNSPQVTSSTTLPTSPSNWTSIDKSEDVVAGVITLDSTIATSEKIENSYKLTKLPRKWTDMSDDQILMINAGSSRASAGYQSESITLSSGSYYAITFKAYTEAESNASAKLSGDEFEKGENVIRITTGGMWRDYKIYVSTSTGTSITTNLEFWLGVEGENQSTGAVFFDNININQYDNETFNTMLENDRRTNANYKLINLEKHLIDDFLANADFEDALSNADWKLIEESSLKNASETVHGRFDVKYFNTADTKVDDEVTNTAIYGNQYALLINNLKSGFVGYKSAYFTINQHSIYKLSFLAKTGSLTGSATVKLVERNPYTNEYLSDETTLNPYYYQNSSYEAQTFEMTDISTSGYSSSLTNDWKTYTFYINGNNLIDTEVNLELWLGTSDAEAKGYVFFDHFTLEQITTNDFNSNSSNGTVADLNQNNTATDFANGTFNLVNIETARDTYPYAPQNWTLNQANSTASANNGIINTSNINSANTPIIPAINNKYNNNNILMIGNVAKNNQKYTSQTLTIEANTLAKITVDVLTTQLSDAKAGISVVCDSVVLGEILNIDTNLEWQTITLFVKTSFEAKDVQLELSLGKNKEGTGFAFFDNVIYHADLAEEAFENELADKKIDLTKNDWTNLSAEQTINNVYGTNDWSASNADSLQQDAITAGVIDTTKYGTNEGYNESSFDGPSHPENQSKNVLMIKSLDDTYYTFKENKSHSIEAGEYYKISVWVKTDRINQSEENIQYKDNAKTKAYPFGASINVDGIDATFAGIDTDGEWREYTIYINCTTTSDISLELSLGSEKALTKGVAYFSTTSITKIESSEYADGISVLNEDSTIDNVLAIGNTDVNTNNSESSSNTSQSSGAEFNWLVVPSLITGIAILFAVGMVIYRNVKKKAPKKAKIDKPYSRENVKRIKNSHRQEILSLNEKRRELVKMQNRTAIDLNNAKSQNSKDTTTLESRYNDLTKKIEILDKQRKQVDDKYKQKISELKLMQDAEKRND